MDNKPIEKLGELYIKSILLKYGFDIHSELSYDKEGTDLIITQNIDNKTINYIKIQSKARRLKRFTNVRIPKSYVDENFVLFVYVLDEKGQDYLFCFFEEELKEFNLKDDTLYLNISNTSIKNKLSAYVFDKTKAEKLKSLFKKFKQKTYTTLIIDGVFLKESILETGLFYSNYWERKLNKPKLHDIIKNIISMYNRFENNQNDIACYVYISNQNDLSKILEIDNQKNNFSIDEKTSVKTLVSHSNELVSVQIMDDINHFNKTSNLILVANDIVYESYLNNLVKEVEEVIIMRLKVSDRPNEMFVDYKWGDISYPIALSMGVQPHEW